jgi:hypothetical protein
MGKATNFAALINRVDEPTSLSVMEKLKNIKISD